jgi:pimeloyl-ACP methyl ester carboxylesterase
MTRRSSILALFLTAASLAGCTSHQTKPIVDAQGRAIAGSIASLEQIELGGVLQWVLIRGDSIRNPILLKLHGGPGQAEMATVQFNRLLEKDFIVVEWDQRGAGKSASAIEPESGMRIAQFVEDTEQLTRTLLSRFHQEKLILVGHSWGSVIGLQTVQKYPQFYRAFVSTGQIVNFSEGMRLGYDFLLKEAKRRDAHAFAQLTSIGPPPYEGAAGRAKRDTYISWLGHFGAIWHSDAKYDRVGWMMAAVEYSWPEKLRYTSAAEKSFELLLPQLAVVDLSASVPKVEVPVYFAVGRYDHMAPFEVSERYFSALLAPDKHWIWFEGSAHFPQLEESQKFHDLLATEVLAETR